MQEYILPLLPPLTKKKKEEEKKKHFYASITPLVEFIHLPTYLPTYPPLGPNPSQVLTCVYQLSTSAKRSFLHIAHRYAPAAARSPARRACS